MTGLVGILDNCQWTKIGFILMNSSYNTLFYGIIIQKMGQEHIYIFIMKRVNITF